MKILKRIKKKANSTIKIWHISDTHGNHDLLNIPKDIDIVIHSGDASNNRDCHLNEPEFQKFLLWYSKLPIKYKIFIAGNHDTCVEKNLFDIKSQMKEKGIIYLENEDVTIEGIKIWGSPHTPQFGKWAFMKQRHKLSKVWKNIPDDTDIVVVHGPPKGFLDLSFDFNNYVERCGCNALKKKILEIEPKLCLFGHIHNNKDIINAGIMKLSTHKTIFSNGSVVTDGKFQLTSSNGNILEIQI